MTKCLCLVYGNHWMEKQPCPYRSPDLRQSPTSRPFRELSYVNGIYSPAQRINEISNSENKDRTRRHHVRGVWLTVARYWDPFMVL